MPQLIKTITLSLMLTASLSFSSYSFAATSKKQTLTISKQELTQIIKEEIKEHDKKLANCIEQRERWYRKFPEMIPQFGTLSTNIIKDCLGKSNN